MSGHLNPQEFDVEGTVPLAYMAYAVALAITSGALLRKTIPAMFLTLVGFIVVRFPVLLLARPHYLPPLIATWDPFLQVATAQPARSDWIFDSAWVDAAGHEVADSQVLNTCVTSTAHYSTQPGTPFTQHTHAHGWFLWQAWQPADRFSLFQGASKARSSLVWQRRCC